MIVKKLKPTTFLLQAEALNRRLPPHHPLKEKIANDARILRAGYNGEKSLVYTLSLLDNPSFHIFSGLRIPDENGHFQLDNLIISRNFQVLLEVKNIFGTVTFDEFGQMIRSANDIEEGFQSPIEQIIKQEFRLQRWLKNMGLPPVKVHKFVVFSDNNTIIRNLADDPTLAKMVIHEDKLFSKVMNLATNHTKTKLSTEQMNVMTKRLLDAHESINVNILANYGITENELIKGVFCPKCRRVPMARTYGTWRCLQCKYNSTTAHIPALKDYALLIGEEISNREARHFLKVDSPYVVKYLFKQDNIMKRGTTSNTGYFLQFEELEERRKIGEEIILS